MPVQSNQNNNHWHSIFQLHSYLSRLNLTEQKLHTIIQNARERAVLVGLAQGANSREQTLEHLNELELLVDTAGADTVLKIVQGLPRQDGAFFIGKGKAEELAEIVEEESINLVVVDDDLSPMQARNLERVIKRKIVDRSGLILDIFAGRARSSEARTQVELAQLQYMLPRLTRQWTHLSKQYGGIGTKGPGETQIETDRRLIRTRISHLREKLEKIEQQRETQRKGRSEMFKIALVGYTNAGKSTLMRELSGADVYAEDRLFATLDTTVRQIEVADDRKALLSDTVGFIRKLPSHLVASFRSTLAEVREADLLLHVVDIASASLMEQISVVESTLADIDAAGIPTIMVFNKVDALPKGSEMLLEMKERYPDAVMISAMRGFNIAALRDKLAAVIEASLVERIVRAPITKWHALARLHNHADVLEKRYDNDYVYLHIRYSPKVLDHVEHYLAIAEAVTIEGIPAETVAE